MKKSTVNFKWQVDDDFVFPKDHQFYCTGYREKDGVNGTFSIVVKLINCKEQLKDADKAEVFALVEDMEKLLPEKGEMFYFTAGAVVVAKGESESRNF